MAKVPPHGSQSPSFASAVPLHDKPAFTPRKRLRVVTIGAGFSGLILAHKLQHEHVNEMQELVDHVIYETKGVVGGTWFNNKYPGVQCDVPSVIYQFPFDPTPEWSHYYSSGPEILADMQAKSKKWNLDRDIKFNHTVTGTVWTEEKSQWKVTVLPAGGLEFVDWADVVISARGFLHDWKWPAIPNLLSFKGKMIHSAAWDHDFDFSNKRIAVIGNGSSGVQILPELAKIEATTITNFIQGPAWIFAGLPPAALVGGNDPSYNPAYSEAEIEKFRQYPEEFLRYRKKIQNSYSRLFHMYKKDSIHQRMITHMARASMMAKLNHRRDLCEQLIPDWEVGCRRITPGEPFLEAFLKPHVSLTSSKIVNIDAAGIFTEDGTYHNADVIVCATGFDIAQIPPFPVIGRDNVSLAEKWDFEPESYLSVMCPNMPNYFIFTGPNATVGHGSLLPSLDWTSEYILKFLRKIAKEDIASVCPRQEVADEFNRYGDAIHQSLVWTGSCASWFKKNGPDARVTANWPGSGLLFYEMIKDIRGEDFDIRYRSPNRFRFMGDGYMAYEWNDKADLAFYMRA